MPLLDIWKVDKSSILKMTIEQVVSVAGDGKVLDESPFQTELRQYFQEAPTETLANYATHCLESSFNKSGLILQDVVNEFGRRLEYAVENGRYQGVKNAIGHDGLWIDESGSSLVIEVKTTDAYRLSLDTVAGYRDALISSGKITPNSSVLIVVGRTDTGELEAQVRGSKHSWHVRIVGIESLIQLVRVKESADSQETIQKIRKLLTPIEYTRLDELAEIVFTATQDIEEASEGAVSVDDAEKNGFHSGNEKTAPEIIKQKRELIVEAASVQSDTALVRKTRALYWSADHSKRLVATISKRYENGGMAKYWYAYHPSWDSFLEDGDSSFLALGCVDLEHAYVIPLKVIQGALPSLNVTEKTGGKSYWHIKLVENDDGGHLLYIPSPGNNIPLSQFKISLQ